MREAAVIVPVITIEGEPYLILTRRSRKLKSHPGQISFPGGIRDNGEELWETALREMEEEIGVDRDSVLFVHCLEMTETLMSRIEVHPFLALLSRRVFRLNKEEVEELIFVELSLFQRTKEEVIRLPSGEETIKYRLPGLVVWGATARIIDSSLEKILDILLNTGYIDFINDD
ncbi:NUDIX hydrolase [Kosmotoga pacifica]|uniref:NUDIX hydrolase n=1 Tax=Kosmotoga pacifica TaxID=1330330 RepID=UPI00069CA736|nr:CoA pyrophosphatase [Kosmotoga pacifica]